MRRTKLAVAPLRIGTGTPNKVLEAMAVGTPVVATPTAVEAFAFPPGSVVEADSAEAIATEICRLLDDPAAREQVAERGGAVVVDFGAAAQHDQLAAIVSAALAP